MVDNNALEIYKQRYATFRHLDRLRWQLLQISVGVGSFAFVFTTNGSASPAEWAYIGLGAMFIIFGCILEKIRKGINQNNKVLRDVAIQIGDRDIPPVSKPWQSISWWTAWFFIIVGIIFIIISIGWLAR